MNVQHPINDPSLVSYHRPELVRLLPQLEQAYDCWTLLNAEGLGTAKEKYLPKEPAEPQAAYVSRLARSTYTPIYRDSIRSYAGLLSRFQIIDAPESMVDNNHNVDLQGSSMQSFLTNSDEMALRDGGCFVMVDMMPETDANNFFDQQADGRHPYLISINRADVINWSVSYELGVESIERVTVRQLRALPNPDGQYGNIIEPIYYVLEPGKVCTYRVVKTESRKYENRKIDEIATSLPIIPLVWYGATTNRFAQGDLPMDGLADLSIQHYQMRSDLSELLHKCAMPVPVRKGAPIGPDGKPAPLVIGPNTAVDLPAEGGDFNFAEPSGKSLERHQQEIIHVEQLMDRSSLNFLYGSNVKTATEASLRASQVASSVAALTRNKSAMFGVILRLWAFYAGEQSAITLESGLAINDSLMSKPLEASEIAQLVNLYNTNLLSRKTVLEELQRGGVLDPDLVIKDEIGRIDEGQEEREEHDMELAEEIQAMTPEEPAETEQRNLEKAAEVAK